MPLHIDPTDGGYRLEGELDMATAEDLLTAVRAHQDGMLTLDFSAVSFMDSSGLRALLGAARGRADGDVIVVLDPTPPVRRVLELSLPDGAPGLHVRDGKPRT
jgi:anti-anti-sigma factor